MDIKITYPIEKINNGDDHAILCRLYDKSVK